MRLRYETEGGEIAEFVSPPIRSMSAVLKMVGEKRALGYDAELVEVKAPPTPAEKRKAEKVGSHG